MIVLPITDRVNVSWSVWDRFSHPPGWWVILGTWNIPMTCCFGVPVIRAGCFGKRAKTMMSQQAMFWLQAAILQRLYANSNAGRHVGLTSVDVGPTSRPAWRLCEETLGLAASAIWQRTQNHHHHRRVDAWTSYTRNARCKRDEKQERHSQSYGWGDPAPAPSLFAGYSPCVAASAGDTCTPDTSLGEPALPGVSATTNSDGLRAFCIECGVKLPPPPPPPPPPWSYRSPARRRRPLPPPPLTWSNGAQTRPLWSIGRSRCLALCDWPRGGRRVRNVFVGAVQVKYPRASAKGICSGGWERGGEAGSRRWRRIWKRWRHGTV